MPENEETAFPGSLFFVVSAFGFFGNNAPATAQEAFPDAEMRKKHVKSVFFQSWTKTKNDLADA